MQSVKRLCGNVVESLQKTFNKCARNTENLARDTVSANQNTTERNWKKAKNNETKTEKNSLNRTKALHYP